MDQYVTSAIIRKLRERKSLTQLELAGQLGVTEKAVSKWETGRGYPDISLIGPLSAALGVSVIELFSGENIVNTNRSANMMRSRIYVCPICGNVIHSIGQAVVSCCGILLPSLEAENEDDEHRLTVEQIDDEYYVSVPHEMTKDHYISFIIAAKDDGAEIKKLYPEGSAEARFKVSRTKYLYFFCNRHGLFRKKL